MKKFLSKHFEIILIALTLLFLFMKPVFSQYGERISMLMFATLSFYYLASALLVFLDKQRIDRILRLIYLFGLSTISCAVIAVMARILLLQFNKEFLIISICAAGGTIFVCRLYYQMLKDNNKNMFTNYVKPLVIRSIICMVICIVFLIANDYAIANMFGAQIK